MLSRAVSVVDLLYLAGGTATVFIFQDNPYLE